MAQYGSLCTCKLPYGIWQYTSTGRVEGIAGNVDRDRAYKDYPAFVVGPLAGESTAPGGGTDAGQTATVDKPDQGGTPGVTDLDGSRLPREVVTRRYGPMTRGDLLRVFETADKLGLYLLGELTIGPTSTGDDETMQALAAELGLGCEWVG